MLQKKERERDSKQQGIILQGLDGLEGEGTPKRNPSKRRNLGASQKHRRGSVWQHLVNKTISTARISLHPPSPRADNSDTEATALSLPPPLSPICQLPRKVRVAHTALKRCLRRVPIMST